MTIESPKDGIVVDLIAADGSSVAVGDIICHLLPDDENHALEALKLTGALLELQAKLLEPEQIALRRRVAEIGVEIATAYAEYADFIVADEENKHVAGAASSANVLQAKTALKKAKAEKEKAEIALKTFDFQIDQTKKRHELAKGQLPAESAFIERKINRLTIAAPVSGKLRILVAKGSFVKLGHTIGTIV